MRSLLFLAVFAVSVLFGAVSPALADDVDHFRKFQVPPDEARILSLTGVHEFRCDYEVMPTATDLPFSQGPLPNYQEDLFLFAEFYDEAGRCVGRYRLAVAVNGFHDLKVPEKGIFSFGWNQEKHELISVIDNAQTYSPWSASLVLKDFSYFDHFFFENSTPEKRHGEPGSPDPIIYPVVGVCGDRTHKMQESGFTDVNSYLKACYRAQAKGAVIIYLYKSSFGEEPALPFNPSP
jgi:hypothetical protein